MRMRNGNGANAAAAADFGHGFIVQQGDTIPEQISLGRLQKQCALPNGKFWFGADSEKVGCFVFEAVMVIRGQLFKRRPLLASVMNKLPLIFTNWTVARRSRAFGKLRSALNADKTFHRGKFCSGDLWSSQIIARLDCRPHAASLLVVAPRYGEPSLSELPACSGTDGVQDGGVIPCAESSRHR
jgi:hypothetical protein